MRQRRGALARFDGVRFVVYRRAGPPALPSNRLMGVGPPPGFYVRL